MIMIPINLPITLKIASRILPSVSNKSCNPLFFFVFPEKVLFILSEKSWAPSFIFSEALLAKTDTFSETLLNSSRIFFSILSMFTGSPSICNFSAVVFASGNKTQRIMYSKIPNPPKINNASKPKRIHIVSKSK